MIKILRIILIFIVILKFCSCNIRSTYEANFFEIQDLKIEPVDGTTSMKVKIKGDFNCPIILAFVVDKVIATQGSAYFFEFSDLTDTTIVSDWYGNHLSFNVTGDIENCVSKDSYIKVVMSKL